MTDALESVTLAVPPQIHLIFVNREPENRGICTLVYGFTGFLSSKCLAKCQSIIAITI